MSSIPSSDAVAAARRAETNTELQERPGFGWLVFAGTVLGLAGLMRVIDAIWAFGYKAALPDGLQDGILGSNLKTYAWTWLVVGILLVVASILILTGARVAR